MTDRQWRQGWAGVVNADPENAHIGRWSSFVVRLVNDGGEDVVLRYEHGAVTFDDRRSDVDADLELRGPCSAWRQLVDPVPVPRRHDLLSLIKASDGIEVVAGRDHLLRHLRVLTRLVELGRAHG